MNKVALVGFYSDLCGACQSQKPIIEQLKKNMSNVEFVDADVTEEENRDYLKELNVRATPTLFIIKNDDIYKKYEGLTGFDKLQSDLKEAMN